MSLFIGIAELISKEADIIDKHIKIYFTGYTAIRDWFDLDYEKNVLELSYEVNIDNEKHHLDIQIQYFKKTYIIVEGRTKYFDRTVTGYLEQSIERELNNKEEQAIK